MSDEADQKIPLRRRISGRMPSLFAQNVLINYGPDAVTIAFFETIQPPVLEITPEILAELRETGLLSECVARITIPKSAFVDVARAFSDMAKNFESERASKEVKNG